MSTKKELFEEFKMGFEQEAVRSGISLDNLKEQLAYKYKDELPEDTDIIDYLYTVYQTTLK